MNAQEREHMKMVNDPKFMADRWQQRLAQNEKEFKKRFGSLSREDKAKYQNILSKQNERAEHYKKKAQEG